MYAMKTYSRESQVEEFHKAMGSPVAVKPRSSLIKLREKLLIEECNEVCQYVLSGTIISFSAIAGSFTPAFNRVHNSNMSKLDDEGKPVYREDGKVTKGPNYKAPDLSDLIV